jgi:hypothetical protein
MCKMQCTLLHNCTGCQFLSIQNWIEDLLWKQLDLDYPGMPEAMVSMAEWL